MYATRVLLLGLCVLLATGGLPSTGRAADEDPWKWSWHQVDDNGKVTLHLYVFWSKTCHRCEEAIPFVQRMERQYPWLKVHWYEITGYPANRELYQRMAQSLGVTAGQVPAFFYCKQMQIGYDSYETHGERIEKGLIRWHQALEEHYKKRSAAPSPASATLFTAIFLQPPDLEEGRSPAEPPDLPIDLPPDKEDSAVTLPWWGKVDAASLSLPALTLVLAGCDAFNPCAFFVLLFLLSMMVHTHSRSRMLLVGGVFVFFSALVYFLFMAAWLNLFFVIGHLRLITTVAGLLAVGVSVVNIKDYFWMGQGVSLSIPEPAKADLYRRMTGLIRTGGTVALLGSTVVLAATVNLYELLCTSGFPLVYTRVLTLHQLPTVVYYLYLVFYNVVYVVPLALIVGIFVVTFGSRKLSEYEGRALKLLSGMMMLVLGILLVVQPEWLSTVGGAILTLVGAISLTALVMLVDHLHPLSKTPRAS